MELKNALSICLISLFSATLVVLIARSLDNQAASRLAPQLAQIVEELRALRSHGSLAATGSERAAETLNDGLVVYYFHGDIRCPTCRAIESQTAQVLANDFADLLDSGQIVWRILNYERTEAAGLVSEFDIHMANVVLARLKDGRVQKWKRLDQVWALYGNETKFINFMRTEITQMLNDQGTSIQPPDAPGRPGVPAPGESPQPPAAAEPSSGLPLPE